MEKTMTGGSIFTVGGCVLMIVVSTFIACVGTLFMEVNTYTTETIHVKKTERIADGASGKYMVFTDDEVFENTDSLLKGKYNSSDLYNKLEEGEDYECGVMGWRIPFLSMYRNLIECDLVEGE